MKENTRNEDSVQNRFTAYLMSAVRNKRMSYMEKKKRIQEREYGCVDIQYANHTDFEQEHYCYLLEQSVWMQTGELEFSELVKILKEKKLIQVLLGLKQRDQDILLARIFQEKSFEEIGQGHGISAKQAEMAYYYVIRKIRKELEGRRYE